MANEPRTQPTMRGIETDPLIGQSFGSYRVVKLLGEGGMGAVYLGEHPGIGSRVAIKVLHPRYAGDPQLVDRFFNEARAVNLIGNDNIVQILDFSVAHGRHYFVMEFLAGSTLQEELRKNVLLPLRRAGPILLQCCRALQAAHDSGIIHRDLKPDNVFLVRRGDRSDFVKIVDFGIAKLSDSGTQHTQAGMVLGTPAYMSPEQAAGETVIDARSDVYSLGVMFFQMVTGRLPFGANAKSARSVLLEHMRDPPPRPRSIQPELPAACEEIILRMLEKEPEARFQTMHELHTQLSHCLLGLNLPTELPVAGGESDTVEMQPATQVVPRSKPGTTPSPRSRPGSTPAPQARPPAMPSPKVVTSSAGRKKPRRWLQVSAVVAAGLCAGAGGIAYGLRPGPQRRPVRPAPPVARALPPEPEPTAAVPEQAVPEQTPTVAATPVTTQAPAQQPPPPRPARHRVEQAQVPRIQLKLATAPESAFVAVWKGGSSAGRTPAAVSVPKGAEVHIRFTQEGYQAVETTLVAAEERVVFKPLSLAR